jgi:Anaphase-promoting complex, cyclosome, subunit 3
LSEAIRPSPTNHQRQRGTASVLASAAGYLLAFSEALLTGCKPPAPVVPVQQTAKGPSESDTAMTLALDALRKLAEGIDTQPIQRTIFYLNQWLATHEPAKASWQEDKLLDTLPRTLRVDLGTPGLERLHQLQFAIDDIAYLQQTLWLHDIATRVRREPSPPELKLWLKVIESNVGLPEAEQLATAERLFDWTIRNLQLDPLPPPPKAPEATAGSKSSDAVDPALQGQLGPGYGHVPLQSLLYGHADAHERARIFILLCRQAGIDAVMLGLEEKASPVPRAWTPAILVGRKLYLFEPSLGLPIPGPDGKGIASLDQIAADPKLLRQLDVEGTPYPIAEKDLANVIALIDAEPAALSRRMQLLQTALPSSSRLALSIQPSQLEPKLRATKALGTASPCRLWRVPLEAILYQFGYQQVAQRDPRAFQEFSRLNAVFAPNQPLAKARNLHLQGRFETKDDKPAARSLYLTCRPPDREIDALKTSEFFRKSQGLDQALPENPAQREAALDNLIAIARLGKFNATYWLGLTYVEDGKCETAIEWLGQRTVQTAPPSPWTPGARYNLARCYEQLGKFDLAREWLESDNDSPQRAGNLLRSKWLAQQHPTTAAAVDPPKPTP